MKYLLAIILLTSAAFAQKTTVTAQVIDSNNTVYQNCRYSVTFVGQSSLPGPYLISGSTFQTDFPGIGCDSFGNLSVQLYGNSLISPTPSQWRFDVCDTTGKFCGFLLATISGLTQNITTPLTPAMPILPISGGGGSPPCGSNGQIQFNNLGVFGCAPGLTSDISGNTLIPGTLGVTGAVSGTTAGFTGNVSALSFTATGPGAIHFHTAFGQAQATPISGQNGCTFATGDGSLQCYSNGGGLAGFLSQGPPASQNVIQPSVGGATLGTSLNANSFEQIRYADQFQWVQSPAGSISIGSNTITINSIRGISQYSFSPGVLNFGSRSFVVHQIRLAGTGTPESVTITGSTCIGSSSGTCTITFTAANTHSAGYTVGTATAGIQEAIVDTFATGLANTDITGWTVKLSPYLNTHNFTMYGTLNIDEILGQVGPLHIDCEGATLEDAVQGAAMITVGGNHTSANIWPSQTLIDNCHFGVSNGNLGRAANGSQVFIWDKSQSLTLRNNNWDALGITADYVDNLVRVSGDQHFIFEKNVWNSPPLKCDTTWCGPNILGDTTNNSAIGAFYDNYMSGFDAIDWESGNGMTLHGNVFQNWAHYPWKYAGGLANVNDLGANYYEGNCSVANPDFGVNGYSCATGRQVQVSGSIKQYSPGTDEAVGIEPIIFSATGANVYTYYIVGNDGSGHSTRPLFIGTASSDGVTNFTLHYMRFNAATYDVLRAGPRANDGTDAAPWGTGNWAVATGLVCAALPCSFTETFAAPTSYTVLAESQATAYSPTISYWPVPLFLAGGGTTPAVYIGPQVHGFVNGGPQSNYGSYYDGIFTSDIGGDFVTGMHILHLAPINSGATGNDNPGAMILNPDTQVNLMSNRKGRINVPSLFPGSPGTNINNSLIYQTYDSTPNQTLATVGHQPLLAAGDIGIGYDTGRHWQATMCGANACTWYVNHVPDSGTSRKMRLTSTALDIPTGSVFSINGVTLATPSTYNAAGTLQSAAHMVEGTCTLGTNCAVTLAGSAIYTSAASYVCQAQDNTAAAATQVVQASGSSFTITGTGTDVIRYSCIGN